MLRESATDYGIHVGVVGAGKEQSRPEDIDMFRQHCLLTNLPFLSDRGGYLTNLRSDCRYVGGIRASDPGARPSSKNWRVNCAPPASARLSGIIVCFRKSLGLFLSAHRIIKPNNHVIAPVPVAFDAHEDIKLLGNRQRRSYCV